jgi:polyisoprenoid-binding protein YceI
MPFALVALLVASAAPAGTAYQLDPSASVLRFHVVHKLHKVDGRSGRIEGKAIVQQDGNVLAMVRAPLAEFTTGDGNRDAHMQETLESGSYPYVVLKGVSRLDGGPRLASAGKHESTVQLNGEIEMHGTKQPIAVPVKLEFRSDGSVRARASFDVSLDAFKIERPALLFVKIDDACHIDVDLVLKEAKT